MYYFWIHMWWISVSLPIDKSVTKNQGIRIFFEDGSRIVMRLSGTGSSGATVRMYVDTYESDRANQFKSAAEMLAPCIEVALQISKLPTYTGKNQPTVILLSHLWIWL